jgi:hypothetical protein
MEDTRIPEDPELDAALRDHFRAELDGQLGRAAARFGHHLRGTGSTGSGGATGSPPPGGRARGGWVVGIVGGAMAASIAGLWAGPALFPAGPAPRHAQHPVPVVPVAHYNLDLDDVTLTTQTRDGGTVLLDGRTPARRIVRNELKQVRWVDAEQNVSFEKIEPRQTIMLIEMDTY